MRTKFKISILSMLAIVFTFAFVLVGCGDSKTSGETISLTEAKTLIVSALATDDNPDNRSIFAKFGKTQFNTLVVDSTGNMNGSITGVIEGNSTNFGKYQYESDINGKRYTYFDGINSVYSTSDITNTSSTLYYETNYPYHDLLGTTDTSAFFCDFLFTDSAFSNNNLYNNSVEKSNNNDELKLSFKFDVLTFGQFGIIQCYNNNLFDPELVEYNPNFGITSNLPANAETDLRMTICINNGEIDNITIQLKMEIPTYNPAPTLTYTTTISKYTGEITEPQWVTDYLAEQAQTQE